jgi:hypothetical protein
MEIITATSIANDATADCSSIENLYDRRILFISNRRDPKLVTVLSIHGDFQIEFALKVQLVRLVIGLTLCSTKNYRRRRRHRRRGLSC